MGLDNEKDAMTSYRKNDKPSGKCTSTRDRSAGGNTGRLFLTFDGPVCTDRISNCPLDRVLTYKTLIYLLNLQVSCFLYPLEYFLIFYVN